MDFKFELGSRLQDVVTGHEGIATGRAEFLNGCKRYALQARVDKEGKVPDTVWHDEEELEVVDEGVAAQFRRTGGTAPGGPRLNPERRADPV